MPIQIVNIFEGGDVPTASELAEFISSLNTELNESVTLTGDQSITGVKTFLGNKKVKFQQSVASDKIGFTFLDNNSKELANFEYDNKNNFKAACLGNYFEKSSSEWECNIGFKMWNKVQGSAYRLLTPLAGNAKTSIPSLSDTYTNFYLPLVFVNGNQSVMTDSTGKVDLSTLIAGGGSLPTLATVATTGDYDDLINKPTLFSGSYNDLTDKPSLFSGSYNDLTDKPTLFSGDYTDLTNKPTIPANLSDLASDSTHRLVTDALMSTWNSKSDFSGSYNDLTDKPSIPSAQVNSDWNSSSGVSQILNKPNLAAVATSGSYNDLSDKPTIPTIPTIPDSLSDLSDDSTHRLVTDTEKATWNNKSDFSGSYNDLTDKPTIPTVPAISTNINNDATSDTKTASPKAVKTFVEGKGYLTQHQDISGKANQSDLESLEDRVEALEQGGTDEYLKLIDDLDSYTSGPVGEIVKYVGQTTNDYTNGWDYKKVQSGGSVTWQISDDAMTLPSGGSVRFPFRYVGTVTGGFGHRNNQAATPFLTLTSSTPQNNDLVVYWEDENFYNEAIPDSYGNLPGTANTDFAPCTLSKFVNDDNVECYIKGSLEDFFTDDSTLRYHDRVYDFRNATSETMYWEPNVPVEIVPSISVTPIISPVNTMTVTITDDSVGVGPNQRPNYPYAYLETIWGEWGFTSDSPTTKVNSDNVLTFGRPVTQDTMLAYWEDLETYGVMTMGNFSPNLFISKPCPVSKFGDGNGNYLYVKGNVGDLLNGTIPDYHDRFYFQSNNRPIGSSIGSSRFEISSSASGSTSWEPVLMPSESPTFTPSKVLVSDANGEIAASSITTAELNALSGIGLSVNKLIEGIYKQMKFNIADIVPYTNTSFIAHLYLKNTTISALTQNSYIYFYFNGDVSAEFSSGATGAIQQLLADGESTQNVELLFKDGTAVSGNLTSIHTKKYGVITVKVGTVVNNKLRLYFQDDITDALN